jgi:secondary thiamine-phosphate synthase enzyme
MAAKWTGASSTLTGWRFITPKMTPMSLTSSNGGTGKIEQTPADSMGGSPMLFEYSLRTSAIDFTDITPLVRESVAKSGVTDGIAVIYCPHTTAGITVNENADPDVVTDILLGLDKAFPDRAEFRHSEGNSAAHLKTSAIGTSATIIISQGRLLLGTWQGIYFCEFDPPRGRKFFVKILASKTSSGEAAHGN